MTDDREQPDLDRQWEHLARFLAGETSPEDAGAMRAQLEGNPDRAALVDALAAALPRPDEQPLPSHKVEAALASVMARRDRPVESTRDRSPAVIPLETRRGSQPRRVPPRWRAAALSAAAAVVLAAGLGVVWRANRSTRTTNSVSGSTVAAAVHRTQAGQIDTLRLADGSTVVLGPESRLSVGARFGAEAREVRVEGLAYFDVVHDDAHPFLVRTADATLRDVGTTFSVRSDSIDGTRVAVTSGAVDVAATQGTHSPPTVLRAGDRAELSGGRMRVERGVPTEEELAWMRGVLEFRDASLPAVAEELRRWYGVKLVVTDSAIASRRLTASFEHATADEIGRVLGAVLGGAVTRSGDTLRLGAAGAR
jgi:transmembrane sensor